MYMSILKLRRNICQDTKRIIFEWQKYELQRFSYLYFSELFHILPTHF